VAAPRPFSLGKRQFIFALPEQRYQISFKPN
jgi:hypothetical protein